MSTRWVSFLIVLAVAAAVFAIHRPAATAVPIPGKQGGWEYKILNYGEMMDLVGKKHGRLYEPASCKDMAAALTKLGQDGWELIVVESPGSGTMQIYYFKRPT